MNESMFLILSFIISFLVCFAATPIAEKLAHKIGAIDVPKDSRRMHKTPIARLGGLAIFFGFLISVICFGKLDREMIGILVGSVMIVAIGIVDDSKGVKPIYKLLVQIAAALVVVLCGVRIEVFTNPNIFSPNNYLILGYLAVPVTVIWIVAITNAVNLIDGLDGLAAGVASISSVSLLLISLIVSEMDIAIITAAIAGACFGFLPYNFNPAKIFMGDTGATFLGFVLATISVEGLFKGYAVISFAVPILILGLPLFDTLYAIIRRFIKRKPIMQADRGHLHHKLIDMGFSQKQAVFILYALSGVLGLSAVIMTGIGAIRAIVLIVAAMVFIVAGAYYMSLPVKDKESKKEEK